jgi:hypothetical protein
MPRPLYLHPFREDVHYIGVGPKPAFVLPSSISLHGVSPTLGRARYKYLYKMEPGGAPAHSTLFAGYMNANDRIYVMGHGVRGSDVLTTESGGAAANSRCTAVDLADIFDRHGLPPASNVTIRIHACESSLESVPGQQDSFAHWFKAAMQWLGYNNVVIQGYDVGVGMYLFFRWGAAPFSKANNHRVTV